MQYSFKKGLAKGIVSALTVAIAIVSLSGLADFTIWDLLDTYLKPVLGALTTGAALTMALNFVKVKYLS